MNKKDVILLASVIAVSVILFIPSLFLKSGSTAYIYVDGKLNGRYDLASPLSFTIENNDITDEIEIRDGCIRIADASCPGRQCVHTGRISRNNESICCAPAGILIVVKAESEGEFDAITK